MVREALERDLPEILAIHNAAVAETTAIWDEEPVDLAERLGWWRERVAKGYPVLVAEIDGAVAGYATYSQWRPKVGFRYTVENSIYVADRFQGRGVATALLAELLARARRRRAVHAMVAAIESTNTTSIRLHEKFGFRTVGELPEVGHKFGRWLDLTLMQLTLASDPEDMTGSVAIPLRDIGDR
ncbi:GNAT family N-acetyltransferase [Nocardia sp. CDC159]|uniref:GNAT family N-acetyltransferase n=1 Tax=Nocardia pulmonis TaxID=2951408 RepID=A0A9X2IV17_9NOCA|nr:GNAT family N-acetyltransferase [Nocardia pulmonis]MCM6786309.1 GNAT family N-acetyltransferase [Nocardia sp. CDC159]